MRPLTLEVPDELAERLGPLTPELPRILELGLRQIDAEPEGGYEGSADVFELLARLPSPEEILSLRPSPKAQSRISDLLSRRREGALTPAEEREWRHYEYLEHLVRMAKATARLRLAGK